MFFSGGTEVLQIGLHPEWSGGSVAVRNSKFKRGKSQWGYQWVGTKYPGASSGMKREYDFEFRTTELAVMCQGQVLITIPYNELTSDKDGFLSGISSVKFVIEKINLKFSKVCGGTHQPIPKLIVYDASGQRGKAVTIIGPTSNFGDINFNDRTDSVYAVTADWELYTGYNYHGTRFFVSEGDKLNARDINSYSSARPANCRYISDPNTAKIRVSTSSHYQYGLHEFLMPQKSLGSEWGNKITSVIVDKGDWEFYKGNNYAGSRLMLKEGQAVDHLDTYGFSNNINSFRPVCETYTGKEKCTL